MMMISTGPQALEIPRLYLDHDLKAKIMLAIEAGGKSITISRISSIGEVSPDEQGYKLLARFPLTAFITTEEDESCDSITYMQACNIARKEAQKAIQTGEVHEHIAEVCIFYRYAEDDSDRKIFLSYLKGYIIARRKNTNRLQL
jgi:hypothetical protein